MSRRPYLPIVAAILVCLMCAGAAAQEGTKNVLAYRGEQPARAAHGMVVTVHHLASDTGLEILRQGGNAVDAAVATGFALAVVHPVAGNIGGGGFMLVHLTKGAKRDLFIDYREEAPGAASRDMYLDAQRNISPGASTLGYKSVAVPGSVAGLAYAEKHYGKLGLKAVIAPAIKLAEDGF